MDTPARRRCPHFDARSLPLPIRSCHFDRAREHLDDAKQRVHAALRRQPVDRIPVFMWFHPQTARRLAGLLSGPRTWPRRWATMSARAGLATTMRWRGSSTNTRRVACGRLGHPMGLSARLQPGSLGRRARDEALRYHFPVERQPALLDLMAPCRRMWPTISSAAMSPVCVRDWRLRGMTDALTDMAADPGLAREKMFRRCADFSVQSADRMPLDWLWAGDDVAAQQGMMA